MDTADRIYSLIRPTLEAELPADELAQADAFSPGLIDASMSAERDDGELGVVDLLAAGSVASYLVILQAVLRLAFLYRAWKRHPDGEEPGGELKEDLAEKVSDKALSELIVVAKQVSTLLPQ